VTRHNRNVAAWLQARGWRQGYDGLWRSEALGISTGLTVSEAFSMQNGRDRAAALGDRRRDMAAVEINVGDDWMEAALQAVRESAALRTELTTDDVLDDHPAVPEPHDGRAWGPVMVRAKAEGVLAPTDRMAPSSRRSSNGRRKMIWRSLVCAPPTMATTAAEVAHGT